MGREASHWLLARPNPANQYAGTQINEISRRKKLFAGEKEQLLQVIVNVGTYYSLTVPAERRAEVDALIAELENAMRITATPQHPRRIVG